MNQDQQSREAIIAEIEGWPRRIGKKEFLAYLRGEYLTAKNRRLMPYKGVGRGEEQTLASDGRRKTNEAHHAAKNGE